MLAFVSACKAYDVNVNTQAPQEALGCCEEVGELLLANDLAHARTWIDDAIAFVLKVQLDGRSEVEKSRGEVDELDRVAVRRI
ncbi:hypothetical protein C0989_007598 [Termitomyces sp. Mn162]|nr:hypothetical protein C0989_007598 [Termitomyces sp. Mn162]